MSFHQIYVPILNTPSSNLYCSLFFQKQINASLGIKSYDLDLFLRNCGLDDAQFNESLRELERFDLVRVYIQNTVGSEVEFTVKLEEVRSIKAALKNEAIANKLKGSITPEKYSELRLLVEDIDYGYEVDLNVSSGGGETKAKQEGILDEETYCTFYNGIFRSLNSEFSLCDDVLRMVRDYHIIANGISMERLQQLSCLSVKEENGKLSVSPEHLRFLVQQETQKEFEFNGAEYDEFWRELLIMKPHEARGRFDSLFSRFDGEGIYRLLTAKGRVPATLNKWIRDCIRSKNLNFPILNASISFVKTLLGKVPINYLIKLTDTLANNGISGEDEFLDHIRKVIAHDSENQNRMNARTEAPKEVNANMAMSDVEPCFFSKKSTY